MVTEPVEVLNCKNYDTKDILILMKLTQMEAGDTDAELDTDPVEVSIMTLKTFSF